MKKVFFVFLFFNIYWANAQTEKRGTIKIKKVNQLRPDCLNVEVHLTGEKTKAWGYKDGDTLTFSELNNVAGIMGYVNHCLRNQRHELISYEVSINNQNKVIVKGNSLNINKYGLYNGGTLIISNCIFNVIPEKDSSQIVILPIATFHIIPDK